MKRFALALVAALLTLTGTAATAAAEEQPSILKAYGLDWIERVREDAWPQPKEQRPIICLLDTGVAVTPDTPEDNPLGPIVARLALDGGTGLPQGDQFEHLHGTQMASVIAAPRNGFGTVGVFPQARIVSIRVTEGADTTISPIAVRQGVQACRRWAIANSLKIAVVVMAEANYDQRITDLDHWQTAARQAADLGGAFVAAAGNSPQADVVAPLAVGEILTVAAGNSAGERCPFASLPRPNELRGPGCSEAREWPPGSSAATAALGGLVGALATLTPSELPSERIAAIRRCAAVGPDQASKVDAHQLAERFLGFIDEVSQPANTQPESPAMSATPARPSVSAPDSIAPRLLLWKPRIKARWVRGQLELNWTSARTGVLVIDGANASGLIRVSRRIQRVKGVRRKPKSITVWVESKDPRRWRSMSVRARVS